MVENIRSLDEIRWKALLKRIHGGRCVPFIGSGFAMPMLKTGTDIAKEWAKTTAYPFEDNDDLARVAQYVSIRYKNDLLAKEEFIDTWIQNPDETDAASRANYDFLAQLPLPVYITTNYDSFLEDALIRGGKKPSVMHCRWNSYMKEFYKEDDASLQPNKDNPIVFHLHGHKDDVRSIVLTEDDYIEFLISMASNADDFVPYIVRENITLNSIMFIGYSLSDLNFRVLFQGLRQTIGKSMLDMSISVQIPPATDKNLIEYLDRYFEDMEVYMYWGSASSFVSELKNRIGQEGE